MMTSQVIESRISQSTSEGLRIKGYLLEQLIGEISFGDLLYLLMMDDLPKGNEGKMLAAMLVSCVDHGPNAPSIHAARTVASAGVPLPTAVAAGISAIGEHHGGAGEACGRFLAQYLNENVGQSIDQIAEKIIQQYQETSQKIPGLGHRIYKDQDPRAEKLFQLAKTWDLSGKAVALLRAVAEDWQAKTGKHLAINIDGAQGAILVDMGIPWEYAKSVFLIGRAAGLSAHAHEQVKLGKPFQFGSDIKVNYTGPGPRDLTSRQEL
jgi:citrate synthase